MAALALRLSSLDALRVARGHCLSCDWCPRFLSPSKRILCDYCGCPPAKHHRIEGNDNAAKKRGGGKKMRLAAAVLYPVGLQCCSPWPTQMCQRAYFSLNLMTKENQIKSF